MAYTPRHMSKRKPGGAAATGAVTGVTLAAGALGTAGSAQADPGLPAILQKIRFCESGGNYAAQNPESTASGAFQFLDTTWRGIPGTEGYARAKYAPEALQNQAAIWLYQTYGTSPWLASQPCWSKLGGVPGGPTSVTRPAAPAAQPAPKATPAPRTTPAPRASASTDRSRTAATSSSTATSRSTATPPRQAAKPVATRTPVQQQATKPTATSRGAQAPVQQATKSTAKARVSTSVQQAPAKPRVAQTPETSTAAKSTVKAHTTQAPVQQPATKPTTTRTTAPQQKVKHAPASPRTAQGTQATQKHQPTVSKPASRTATRPTPHRVTQQIPQGAPRLTQGYQSFPHADVALNAQEKAALAAIDASVARAQVKTGVTTTVTTTVAPGHPGVTHSAPNNSSSTVGWVVNATSYTGQFVDTDWFKITTGPQAGQYLSAAFLPTKAPVNGRLDEAKQLVELPGFLVDGGHTVHLNANAAKSLVRLHAALRQATGENLVVIDGYRSSDVQQELYKTYGYPQVAMPGTSNHGVGLAIGVNGRQFDPKAAAWIDTYARGFGWYFWAPASTPGYLSVDYAG